MDETGALRRSRWVLAAVAGVGAALAAPAGFAAAEESPQDLVNRLQQEGYTVTIDKIGTAPMSDCIVTNVRNPQQDVQLRPLLGPGTGDRTVLVPVTVSQTISVSLDCSG